MTYNTKAVIVYENTREYRACLRLAFSMNTKGESHLENYDMSLNKTMDDNEDAIDAETLDEWDYDNNASELAMDHVFELTKEHPLFKELYLAAAGAMFSIDPTIGQCVLFAYDSFALYHQCIACFIEFPDMFTEDFACYQELRKRFVK